MVRWIDVSMPLFDGMIGWPGDPAFRCDRVQSVDRGDDATVSALGLSSHAGTHMDAPAHVLAGGTPIDAAPPAVLIGPARVVAIANPAVIDVADLQAADPRPGERLLLRTANSDRRLLHGPFTFDYIALSAPAARFLADRRVALVGVDGLSVGRPSDGIPTHRILLGAGIWVVEGLDLAAIGPGECHLVCLPLRIRDGDGAPARVLLGYDSAPPGQKSAPLS